MDTKTSLVKKQNQYIETGFHIPTTRTLKKFREEVFGHDLLNAIKEIKNGSESNPKIPIKNMLSSTKQIIEMAEKIYKNYLKNIRDIKDRKLHEKKIKKWEENKNPILKIKENENVISNRNKSSKKLKNYKVVKEGKKLSDPGEFILDKFEKLDEWSYSIAII